MIKGWGGTFPKIFFIADSPSNRDHETGYAIDGSAGDKLKGFAYRNGISVEQQWRTCLNKETQGDDKNGDDFYKSILLSEIDTLKPSLLVPMGELSFNFITGLNNIRKFRGSVLPSNIPANNGSTIKVLPILGPHPYLEQEYRLIPITRIDFSKIPRYMNDAPIPDDVYNIWVVRTSSALRNFLERSYQKTLDEGGVLTFDIETYFQIPICISLCFDGFESVCVPLIDSSIDRDHRILMIQLVSKLLSSPIPKINQNIKYDWKILERWNFKVANVIGDTMLAASALYCEFPKNLGFLTSIYTDLPYFKDEGHGFDPEKTRRDRYYLYNAKDSLATSQIYRQQKEEVKEKGVQYVYDNLIKCLPIYKGMEDRGIRIDKQEQLKLLCKYESLFHSQEIKLRHLTGMQYVNPLSPVQCKNLIFNELGYTKIRGMKTLENGEPSTDEDSLDLLSAYGEPKRAPSTGPPVLEAIIGARKIHKVIEILTLHLHPDERFRCEFNLAGTENARTSGGKTTDQFLYIEDGYKLKILNLGHSLQTIGKHGFSLDGRTYGQDLRRMFVPSYGYNFVEIDLSQAEARVDAVLSGNYDILKVFDSAIGIHRLTGSWGYNCPPEDIKKGVLIEGVDRYHVAKQIRHSFERNIQAETLRVKFLPQLPLQECKRLLTVMDKKQPEIKGVFHRDVRNALEANTHCLVAPNGRRRDFFDRIDKNTINEGISFLPQAIVSDQTKFEGIAKTHDFVKDYSYLLNEQHDGVLYEVKKGHEEQLGAIYKKNVEEPIDFRMCTLNRDFRLSIPCEISIGENWYKMEDLK